MDCAEHAIMNNPGGGLYLIDSSSGMNLNCLQGTGGGGHVGYLVYQVSWSLDLDYNNWIAVLKTRFCQGFVHHPHLVMSNQLSSLVF